jgi:hypothetical protein
VKYVKTNDMIADVLTKPLQGEQFVKLRDSLKELMTEARVGMGMLVKDTVGQGDLNMRKRLFLILRSVPESEDQCDQYAV